MQTRLGRVPTVRNPTGTALNSNSVCTPANRRYKILPSSLHQEAHNTEMAGGSATRPQTSAFGQETASTRSAEYRLFFLVCPGVSRKIFIFFSRFSYPLGNIYPLLSPCIPKKVLISGPASMYHIWYGKVKIKCVWWLWLSPSPWYSLLFASL